MINKIYKIINNKFSRFFKFVFFIRYLFVIFFVAITIFLLIPHFFDYKKKEEVIKAYLKKSYNLEVKALEKIKFKSFPTPHLEIISLTSVFLPEELNIQTNKLYIYPKFSKIYDYNNYQAKKIIFENNKIETNFKKTKILFQDYLNLEKKLSFKNLKLDIIDNNNNNVVTFDKINFSNFGYKRNIITGELFDKNFKIKFQNNLNDISFRLLNTGVLIKLNLNDTRKRDEYNGNLKGKILKSNFKLDFIYNESSLKINNFFFRNQDISVDSEGTLKIKPFFKMSLNSKIKDINLDLLKKININEVLNSKDLIKRVNIQNHIIFEPKRFSRSFVDKLDLKTQLSYGRLKTTKIFLISETKILCENYINLLEEFPIFYFRCNLNSPDKRKLFKKINIDYKQKKEALNLNFQGNLNILKNKINFDNIEANQNYQATEEDLKFFKSNFENILFDQNFLNIFSLAKIKKFILEIS